MAARIFHTEGITKVYRTGEVEVWALRGVDIELFMGEFTVLLGASGSGKSTLLNILGGLDRATDGKAWFRDKELTAMRERDLTRYRRDHVGFVFQFYNLVPSPHRPRERRPGDRGGERSDERPRRRSTGSASTTGWTISRPRCRAASSSASPSRAPSPSAPRCCCATNPPARSTARPASRCSKRSNRINDDLGTTTIIITHNAGIQKMAHRVIHFADGNIASVTTNDTRIEPRDIVW